MLGLFGSFITLLQNPVDIKLTKYHLSFSRLSSTKVPHVNLTPFRIHHNRNRIPFLLVQPPHPLDNHLVPLPRPVTHIDPRHVHPAHRQRLQLLEPARGGPDGADKFRPPRAAEPVLLKLRFGHRVHLDRGRVGGGGPVQLGDEGGEGG